MEKRYDPQEAEERWMKHWEAQKTYAFDPENTEKPLYAIDTPPPTVSGKMHMGHAFGNSQQDFMARFKRMSGFNVLQPFGTDDNGLPTQLLIQKLKKVRAKDMSRKDFTALCLKTLKEELRPKYTQDWKRLGISCDFNVKYTTINEHSQKVSQESFLDLYKKDLAYRKKAPAMVCPQCKTSIAQVELEDLEREATLYHVKVDVEGKEVTFATTRPELMMACIALSVHPDDERYKDLVGKKATIPGSNVNVPVIVDDLTKMEFGSGVVYWCPYGDTKDLDFVAKHPELEVKNIMNPDGVLNEKAGKYQGMKSEEAKKAVVQDWKDVGAIVKEEKTKQVVNTHERCGTPIEFVSMYQWMIKVKDEQETWLKRGEEINWNPDHMVNRYNNWVNGLKWDWNISRQIFFGVPFPVWYCTCGEVITAKEEDLPVDPLEDAAPPCPKCGKNDATPEGDIINTWATSSLTPTIVTELFKDKPIYKKLKEPWDLRPQGHDIISFWLFNTVVKSHYHHNQLPWKNTFINGWMLDPKGKKMSKSKGNIIEPQHVIQQYSADALRYMAASSKLGDDLPYQEKDVKTGQKTVTKLWNASKFVLMNLEGYDGKEGEKRLVDRWAETKLHKLIKQATEYFETYQFARAKLDTDSFFWKTFCDNYLELVKGRLYNEEGEAKKGAQATLREILETTLTLFAPILPFITEEIYQQVGEGSIHTSAWPQYNPEKVDESAEKVGDVLVQIVEEVRKTKSQAQVSMKTPVKRLYISADIEEKDVEDIRDEIESTTSAEEIVFKKGTFEVDAQL